MKLVMHNAVYEHIYYLYLVILLNFVRVSQMDTGNTAS